MAKGDDLEIRLIDFVVSDMTLCDDLPKTPAGKHIAGQLIRSRTAPAALYAEARGAESSKDFVHKLKLCLKELNESQVWLKIIAKSKMYVAPNLNQLQQERNELCRIVNASVQTASKKLKP